MRLLACSSRARLRCARLNVSLDLAVLLFDWGFQPLILQVPAIWHNYSWAASHLIARQEISNHGC